MFLVTVRYIKDLATDEPVFEMLSEDEDLAVSVAEDLINFLEERDEGFWKVFVSEHSVLNEDVAKEELEYFKINFIETMKTEIAEEEF